MDDNQIRRILLVDGDGGCCGKVARAGIAVNAGEKKTAEIVQEVSRASA